MSNDNAAATEESGAGSNGESWSSDTSTLEKIRIERDREAKARKAAETEKRELEARLAKIEEEQQRANGELSKVIESKDKKLQDLLAQQAEWKEKEKARIRSDRESALLDAVASKTGDKQRTTLEALLHGVAKRRGVDIAPEEVTDDGVAAVLDALKSTYPDQFSGSGAGGSPALPGLNKDTKAPGQAPGQREDKGKSLAERLNAAQQNSR